jgi:hypothetical protein
VPRPRAIPDHAEPSQVNVSSASRFSNGSYTYESTRQQIDPAGGAANPCPTSHRGNEYPLYVCTIFVILYYFLLYLSFFIVFIVS